MVIAFGFRQVMGKHNNFHLLQTKSRSSCCINHNALLYLNPFR